VFIGGAVVVGAPFFYPYPYPYDYPPPAYPAPAYAQPPAYVEQGVEQGAGPYYYCPDYGDYYPNVAACPSQWMEVSPGVSPGQSGYPN
jgi:hypothetical protein